MMIARLSTDARFGRKQAIMESLLVWLRDIGSEVGWSSDKVRIVTGSIGAPESSVEMEVQVSSLEELNASWEKLGTIETNKDWSREIEPNVISGTPKWTIFRVIK